MQFPKSLPTILTVLVCVDVACAQASCYTYDQKPGFCINIRSCHSVWSIIKDAPRPLPKSVVDHVQRSYCGNLSDRTICCEPEDISSSPSSTQAPVTHEYVGRKNIHLLNNDDDKTGRQNSSDVGKRETDGDPSDVSFHPNLRFLDSKNCGPLSLSTRLSGGSETSMFDFPWMALLGYNNSVQEEPDFKCAGSLISSRFVLTVAHCLVGLPKHHELKVVRLGEYSTSSDTDCERLYDEFICLPAAQDIEIDRVITHPSYNRPKYAHDIGLVKLRDPADMTHKRIKPVCLPVSSELLSVQPLQFTVTGWGQTGKGYTSDILTQAGLSFISQDQCTTRLSAASSAGIELTKGQFCAVGVTSQVDSCKGDSGSPLVVPQMFPSSGSRYVQYGIVSVGIGDCGKRQSVPGVYTNVKFYINWILDNIKD